VGIYEAEIGDKLSDYVVSSYTQTLTAILCPSVPKMGDNFRILTIAQPSTPYATPTPQTEDEVEQIQCLAGDLAVVSLKNEEATVERVLQAMRDTDWVHMACHGKQKTGEPMKSGLLLHDKFSSSWRSRGMRFREPTLPSSPPVRLRWETRGLRTSRCIWRLACLWQVIVG